MNACAGTAQYMPPPPSSSQSCLFLLALLFAQEFVHQELSTVYSEQELKAINLVHDLSALQPLYEEYSKVIVCVCVCVCLRSSCCSIVIVNALGSVCVCVCSLTSN